MIIQTAIRLLLIQRIQPLMATMNKKIWPQCEIIWTNYLNHRGELEGAAVVTVERICRFKNWGKMIAMILYVLHTASCFSFWSWKQSKDFSVDQVSVPLGCLVELAGCLVSGQLPISYCLRAFLQISVQGILSISMTRVNMTLPKTLKTLSDIKKADLES